MSLAGKELITPANVVRRIEPSKAARDAFEQSPTKYGGAGQLAGIAKQRKSFRSLDDTLRPLDSADDGVEDFGAQQSSGTPAADLQSVGTPDVGGGPSASTTLLAGTNGPKPGQTTPKAPAPTAKDKAHSVLAVLLVVVIGAVVAAKVLR